MRPAGCYFKRDICFMPEDAIQQFKQKYESLAGVVHLTAGTEEAAAVVASIFRETDAKRIALGDLPEDLQKVIEGQCAEAGVEVFKPPFDRAELPHKIDTAQVGVSTAAFAIAESGTLVEFATNDAFRLVSTLPRVHVGLVRAENLVETLREAAPLVRDFYAENPRNATATFISGPSRTADIEMRLTLGVHGPEVAHAVVVG